MVWLAPLTTKQWQHPWIWTCSFYPTPWKTCGSGNLRCKMTPHDLSFYPISKTVECPSNFCVEVRLLISLRPLCTAWIHGVRDMKKAWLKVMIKCMDGLHENRLCPSVSPAIFLSVKIYIICSYWIFTHWWSMHLPHPSWQHESLMFFSDLYKQECNFCRTFPPAWASMKDSKLASVLASKSFGHPDVNEKHPSTRWTL